MAGWIGFFIELKYRSPYAPTTAIAYTITSQVNVVPDRYPFPDFNPANPPGMRGS